jgi:hypothetical protein
MQTALKTPFPTIPILLHAYPNNPNRIFLAFYQSSHDDVSVADNKSQVIQVVLMVYL